MQADEDVTTCGDQWLKYYDTGIPTDAWAENCVLDLNHRGEHALSELQRKQQLLLGLMGELFKGDTGATGAPGTMGMTGQTGPLGDPNLMAMLDQRVRQLEGDRSYFHSEINTLRMRVDELERRVTP